MFTQRNDRIGSPDCKIHISGECGISWMGERLKRQQSIKKGDTQW
ncbi:hypothetical protein HMPREF1870_01034 [Bacteroidales bacterium KA00344]|nr:hypothetical protein HMPREF1870_01034 [Bacteroidales bacterium KA00344]